MLSRSLLLTSLLLGCDPAAPPGAELAQPPTEDTVAIGSTGPVRLVTGASGTLDAIHVRVALRGQESATTANAVDATLAGGLQAAVHPFAVNAEVATLPIVLAEAGARQIVDLYFPPTTGAKLDFQWTVTTSRGLLAIRTEIAPGIDSGLGDPIALGGARHWWFATTAPWSTFRHQDGTITPLPPRTATVLTGYDDDPRKTECNQW